MKRKAEKAQRKQEQRTLRQVLMPMVVGMAATKQGLMEWVIESGMESLLKLFSEEAVAVAGPKGKHLPDRTHNHWGTTAASFPLGGRHVTLPRPRVRKKGGGEVALPSVDHFQQVDSLPERVVEQILLGVSTRGYEHSLEPLPAGLTSRGTSKSSASRRLVDRTKAKMSTELKGRLDGVDFIALMVDGIEVANHTVVVGLGITRDGSKVTLGLALGSTENAAVCTTLLQGIVDRGLLVRDRVLCVIDGGKGIRKALDDVFGNLIVVQRCQLHKIRNVLDHLPKNRRGHVRRAMREAYASSNVATARRLLRSLVSWLESNGEDDAAASLREGMEETLTVIKLELPTTLRRSLSTTNAIENVVGTVRRVSRNVKRWRSGTMAKRWVALGLSTAQRKFRRIKGHRSLDILVQALRRKEKQLDNQSQAA